MNINRNTGKSCALAVFMFSVMSLSLIAQTIDFTNVAVSQLNGKLSYSAGDMDEHTGQLFDGSVSVPVTHLFGFQADGLYSHISNLGFGGGAGHFFWRDPQIGLLGLTGGYLNRDGVDTYQAGAEGEYYLGRFTFGFFGGVGSIDYGPSSPTAAINPAAFIDTNPTRFVGRLSVDYYPIDNLRIGASFMTAYKDKLGSGELECQTPINGLALTGEVAYGDYGYHHWLLGVRYYFGGHKTLRERQREDDPPGLMRQILYGLGLYGSEFNHKANQYIAETYPSDGGGGGGGGDYGVIITTVNAGGGNWNGGGGAILIPPSQIIPTSLREQ